MLYALLDYDNPGIKIGNFTVYAYALVIVFGMAVAFFVISLLFKRRNMSSDLFLTYFCVTVPVALFTTRLFYCITDGMPFKDWFSFSSIRDGGLSIVGGIVGGALAVVLVSYFKKVNFFRAADCIVVGLMLAQAIGRWGNFFNQEVYGAEVENGALQCFPFAVYINKTDGGSCWQTFTLTFAKWFGGSSDISGGTWHYAFFLYESLANTAVAVFMFVRAWKNPNKPNGLNVAIYFFSYGLLRSIMEPLRDPSYILSGGGVPWSLVFSLLMLAAGAGLFVYLVLTNKKKEGKCFGSLTGDPVGIREYIGDNASETESECKFNLMRPQTPESGQTADAPSDEEGAEEENG